MEALAYNIKRREYLTRDGFCLKVYSNMKEGKENILIFNPVCVSITLLTPLLNELSNFFNVICWETRGTSTSDCKTTIPAGSIKLENHLQDAKNICNFLNFKTINHIIGYCSGGVVAAMAAATNLFGNNVKSVSLIASTFSIKGIKKTTYQEAILEIMKEASQKDLAFSKSLKDMLIGRKATTNSIQDQLLNVNQAPFVNEYSILTYARAITNLNAINHAEMLKKIKQKVLIMQNEDDNIVNLEISNYINEIIPHAELKTYSSGGHFIFYGDFERMETILSFLWSSRSA